MVWVTNNAKGPRGFNTGRHDGIGDKSDAKLKGNSTGQIILQPGESADLDLHDKDHPVVKGMVEKGEIVFGEKKPEDGGKDKPRFDVERLNDDELKAFIKDRTGGSIEGNPSREALLGQARKLAAA